jgi:hypothetical protein
MMEAIRSSETSVLIRATCRNIPEDGILYKILAAKRERKRPFERLNIDGKMILRQMNMSLRI